MKRSLALSTLLATGLALAAAAQTQPAPTAAPSKIAVIAFQVAVGQTNEGERNFADLKKKYEPKEAPLKAQDDEIQRLTKELQTQGSTLSAADRASKARVIDDKKKKLQRDADDLRAAGAQDAQEMYSALASKVYDVMADYAQKEGYTLVFDVSQQQNPVLYAMPSTDITKAVVAAYNLKSGIPAPAASAASAAGAAPKPAAKAPAAH